MAIKANMTTHDGIALTQAYRVVRSAEVKKLEDDSFELEYQVQIYATDVCIIIISLRIPGFKCNLVCW